MGVGVPEGLERDLQAAVLVLFPGPPLPVYFEVFDGLHLYFYHLHIYLKFYFLSLEEVCSPRGAYRGGLGFYDPAVSSTVFGK